MREILKVFLLTFILYSCTLTKLPIEKCSEFRSGKYIYNMYNKSGMGHWTKLTYFITRNDSFEIVTSAHLPIDTAINQITWTGNCEYKSFLLNPKINLDSFLVRQNPTGTIHTIMKVADDYFIVKNNGRKDTIWKAN